MTPGEWMALVLTGVEIPLPIAHAAYVDTIDMIDEQGASRHEVLVLLTDQGSRVIGITPEFDIHENPPFEEGA